MRNPNGATAAPELELMENTHGGGVSGNGIRVEAGAGDDMSFQVMTTIPFTQAKATTRFKVTAATMSGWQ